MIDINTLWNDTKIKLSARLQAISYEVWIEKLEPICFIGHTLVLQTGSQSSKNTIVKNYRETILEAVKEVNPIISDVKIIIESEKADCLKQQDYTLGDELVRRDVHYAFLRKFRVYVISDCVHKVGFSKPDSAVYKQSKRIKGEKRC